MPHGGAEIVINGRFLGQPTTGVQRVARELTREMDALVSDGEYDCRLRLVCQPRSDVADLKLRTTKVQIVDGPKGFLWEQVALPQAVGDSILLCLGNTAPIYSLLRRKPVALMIHDLSYRIFPNAYKLSYRVAHSLVMPILLKYADPILTVSKTEKSMLLGLLPKHVDKIIVAQNGGWGDNAPTHGLPSPKLEGLKRYALYVGSLSQRKNLDGLIKIAIRLAQEDDIDFVFVGSAGSILSPTIVNIPNNVKSRIHFIGQVEDLGTLAEIYRNASCLVFPSFYEASPLPPLEAMRFECPVVASNIPSMNERCGSAAEYCDPSDPEDVMRAVRAVLYDPDVAATLKESGKVQDRSFSWRRQAVTILDALTR